MVNFCLKVAQIGDLSSKIQGFEALTWHSIRSELINMSRKMIVKMVISLDL